MEGYSHWEDGEYVGFETDIHPEKVESKVADVREMTEVEVEEKLIEHDLPAEVNRENVRRLARKLAEKESYEDEYDYEKL